MNRRRTLIGIASPVVCAFVAGPVRAERLKLIGRLHPGAASEPTPRLVQRGFVDGMNALGRVEGVNYRIESRFAESAADRLPIYAGELVQQRVDVIVVSGDAAAQAAKRATREIPIIMAMSGPDPVRTGLVASLAMPGGNITGLAGQADEFAGKHLELLREFLPGLTDVIVLYNPQGVRHDAHLDAEAAALGLKLHPLPVQSSADVEAALASRPADGNWAVMTLADPVIIGRLRVLIAQTALKHRLPSAHNFQIGAENGGLFSYGLDLGDMGHRAAYYVDRILKGTKPADLPVEQATKFRLVINRRVADTLGVVIPASLLVRADALIE